MSEQPIVKREYLLVPCALASLKLVVWFLWGHRYGFHGDEFYFIACGRNFDFGYVDHAPFVPWIALVSYQLFGDSVMGLRFFSASAGALAIVVAGLLTTRLGGGRFAQFVACLGMLIAPVFLRTGNQFSIPSFEPLYWVAAAYLVVVLIQSGNPRWWMAVGLVAGLGLMNKHTMLFFGAGLAVALVLSERRKDLLTPWPWLGGAIALLIFLPNIVWQFQNDFATIEFMRRVTGGNNEDLGTITFLVGQVLYPHPANVLVWLPGLVWLLAHREGKNYRMLAIIYLTALAILLVLGGKIYYLSPAYPMLLAAGAVAWERWTAERKTPRFALAGAMVAGGLLFFPLSIPMMSIQTTERYVDAVTFGALGNVYELTGDLRYQNGWPEIVAGVAEVYDALSEEEQAACTIYAPSYALAGAVDLLGDEYGLPDAVSPHLTYYLWGPGDLGGDVVIAVRGHEESLRRIFEEVEVAGVAGSPDALPWLQQSPILVCRGLKIPLDELWPRMRSY